MTLISIGPRGTKKVLINEFELYKKDIDSSLSGVTPGEWCEFELSKSSKRFWGYINPHVQDNRPCAYIVEEISDKSYEPWTFIEKKLKESINKRLAWDNYNENSRLVYGKSDFLPGLIIDSYVNCILVQINTAGIDKYREEILNYLKKKFPQKEIVLQDNDKFRQGEMLPTFEQVAVNLSQIEIKENDLRYKIEYDKKQKIGYYYDHRENRRKAAKISHIIKRDKLVGLDLFCYIGSWGINLLNSNLDHITFVDQGNFEREITENLKINNMEGKGSFVRKNVFEFLKQNKQKYDVICSDPPAFCKSPKEKRRAIDGYTKLHRNCLELLNNQSVFLASSCTHYVNHQEFQDSIVKAAKQAKRNIQLIDTGVQGWDHPIKSIYDKESYLKYYAYYVE